VSDYRLTGEADIEVKIPSAEMKEVGKKSESISASVITICNYVLTMQLSVTMNAYGINRDCCRQKSDCSLPMYTDNTDFCNMCYRNFYQFLRHKKPININGTYW
jgi:hypothetical protein